jgi:phospholipid/cholesterol/gamma-HCH transport system substrate-binding protein
MKFRIKYTKEIVFIFILIPIFILLVFLGLVATKQRLFEKRFFYYTNLTDATGISTQTPILFKGFEIGRVKDFLLTESRDIKIRFYVLKSYNHIVTKQSVLARTTNPITNKTTLQYLQSEGIHEQLPVESVIISTDSAEGRALYRKITSRSGDAISTILDNIQYITTELTKDDNSDKGSIFRILTNLANIAEKADYTFSRVDSMFIELNTFTGNLNLDHTAGEGTIFRILNNIADSSDKLNEQMLKVDSILISIQNVTRQFENPDSLLMKMIDPTGEMIMKPIQLTINTLHENLKQTLLLLEMLNRNNPELLLLMNNLNETLNNAKKTLEAMNNNPILRSGISHPIPNPAAASIRISELPDEE